ncbi:MAG: bifunctional demethylmenaquinone methyltransferase/2-methoxy-6-polyprenyl-1,4-benzoquinol methylase [Halothiobacillus sp. 24-54-40]|jgi:demethylmenaquinone methyltransferase/2-methoxy-6-polyprenyl-1,4-benzoquinol methylase|nr:MAG: bifunctional demethylmenaquinone methyltransferase/2-methoxy-6-polyprenyl-1,4-benzoquinol methylase [Halothiobacillus sp. 35-54-62]OYY54437.1 MAG: bifunctional demethylmenaquinone methyltransferase/2-methoxy-6-polyprenyl-1,4-benzoquinol methylase [Halothiobacillus sp. 28-55-5]OYZ88092.1 MAG: bifunctional demethylmenaquinone methyltransferase/2-methoxy-6-polyprenyl-1,4-benzoquinol methylase [Halothiobacillus sp. 24-54-40]OZA79967.1 MAG: bifunctional demethylmenaquinone methyltransferase/2
MTEKTHFGYTQVPIEDKAKLVGQVFDSVANRYDVMNDAMSFGIHRLWKRVALEHTGLRRGMQALDLASGTGDLALKMAGLVGEKGLVVLSDINQSMLSEGRNKLDNAGVVGNVDYCLANAQYLPFPSRHFDCVTMGFGLRNVTDKGMALNEMARVLKPGGRAVVLEFSKPISPLISKAYDLYSFTALPALGKILAKDADSYRYLAESIRMHPDQEALKALMLAKGFDRVDVINLSLGVVALHIGYVY